MSPTSLSKFSVHPDQLTKLNEIVLQENFHNRIEEIKKVNVTLLSKPTQTEVQILEIETSKAGVLETIENLGRHELSAKNGNSLSKAIVFCGYDESKYKFLSLEGIANVTTHAFVAYNEYDIYPVTKVAFYFYTKSHKLINKSNYIKYSDEPEIDSNRDYAVDRSIFIKNYAINNTILFIDGPLIGGNITSYTNDLVCSLHQMNVIPIFIVKNSESNLVVDNVQTIKDDFNSDLHWSYQFLKEGQRTNLFLYTDQHNPQNTKIFCYIKPFNNVTTQRIEFHTSTYKLYNDCFNELFDLIYYLMVVHGDKTNPQLRPIAVAEKYAREAMRLVNCDTLLRGSNLIQTMDQSRFGG